MRHGVDQLGTHVLEGVGKVDFLGNRHAVLGDRWSAKTLVDDHISAGGPKGDPNRMGQLLGTCQELFSGIIRVKQLLRHLVSPSNEWGLA